VTNSFVRDEQINQVSLGIRKIIPIVLLAARVATTVMLVFASGCSSRDATYVIDDAGRGVTCYGDSYYVMEGFASFDKRMSCADACSHRGFRMVTPESASQFKEVANNGNQKIPEICK
jgi:hypothetical protein